MLSDSSMPATLSPPVLVGKPVWRALRGMQNVLSPLFIAVYGRYTTNEQPIVRQKGGWRSLKTGSKDQATFQNLLDAAAIALFASTIAKSFASQTRPDVYLSSWICERVQPELDR